MEGGEVLDRTVKLAEELAGDFSRSGVGGDIEEGFARTEGLHLVGVEEGGGEEAIAHGDEVLGLFFNVGGIVTEDGFGFFEGGADVDLAGEGDWVGIDHAALMVDDAGLFGGDAEGLAGVGGGESTGLDIEIIVH